MSGGEVRVAIAGTGFIGAVHARSARLAGARLVGVAASSPERGLLAAAALGAERSFATAEELVEAPDVDVVHICTPNHLHLPLAEAALAAGKHVICEKPLAIDDRGAEEMVEAAAERRACHRRAVRLPLLPDGARGARAHPHRRHRPGPADPRRLPAGLAAAPEDDNWRVDEQLGGASRAFADIGSHWCDLAEFVSGHRITRVCARLVLGARPRDGGRRDPAVRDRPAARSAAPSSARSPPGARTSSTLELDGANEALAFDQEEPEALWVGRRENVTLIKRDPGALSPAAARLATLPAGHPQGYNDCFDAFVADAYAAVVTGEAPDGLPAFRDGLRAARITAAVLSSARTETWVEVPDAAALAVGTADV